MRPFFIRQRYPHDCQNCQMIGRYNEYDLYCCKGEFSTQLVARKGSQPNDTLAIDRSAAGRSGIPPIVEAARIMDMIEAELGLRPARAAKPSTVDDTEFM